MNEKRYFVMVTVSGPDQPGITATFSKIPVLGSLPIFGALFETKDEQKQRKDLIVLVTPEMTTPLATTDAKPNVYMPRDFLVKLDPKDVPEAQPKKSSKKK